MKYILKAGILYYEKTTQPLAQIKGALIGPEKRILSANGSLIFRTIIRSTNSYLTNTSDIRLREYILIDSFENKYAVAYPDYAQNNDPFIIGWPVNRMPRVNHANIILNKQNFILSMPDNQNYLLSTLSGKPVINISHHGLSGGWNIETNTAFLPEDICGIFVFCKYLEQENEFLIV